MDYTAHLQETARHLAEMSATEFAREHTKLRRDQLVASDPLYAGLPELIAQEKERMRLGAKA